MLVYANTFTVHKGEDRIALVGETSTLKVARVDAGRCLDSVQLAWKRGGFPRLQHEWASLTVDQHHSMKYYLLRGVAANHTEAQLASEYPRRRHSNDSLARWTCIFATDSRHIKVLAQLPFELNLRMPSTDRACRGYSNEYIAEIEQQPYSA